MSEKKEVRKIHQDDIVYKEITKTISYPHCPVCKEELLDIGKDYRPYWCSCGDWYWDEEFEGYGIMK